MESSVEGQNQNTEESQKDLGTQDGSDSAKESQSDDTKQAEFEFSHPMLKGKSPEEIERVFKLQESTTRSQGAQLNQMASDLRELKTKATAPPPKVEPEVTSKDFYDDPVSTMSRMLNQAVEPLREEIRIARSEVQGDSVRGSLRAKYSDWDVVEPAINEMLAQRDFPDPNEPGLLETLYYTAKGVMHHQGTYPTKTDSPTPKTEDTRMTPPQHRASTPPAPPKKKEPAGSELRDLTEEEKRLAGEYGMTAEQFIRWQEMDQFEVPSADFDLEKPK